MYETIKRPPGPDVTRHFKIHSLGAMKAIKRDVGGVETMYLEGIASSTVRDRHGDTITANAQAQMLEAAKGLTMWLNHSYEVPEDILGTCEESSLVSAKGAENEDLLDLIIRCKVDGNNPRAVKAWQHVNGGTQLGFSIGGEITEFDWDEENDDGSSWCPPMIINGLELYEISLVGIPANPRAYTRSFVQEMSRGFMRTVARDRNVRDVVMKTFADRRGEALPADLLAPATAKVLPPDSRIMKNADAGDAPTLMILGEREDAKVLAGITLGKKTALINIYTDASEYPVNVIECGADGTLVASHPVALAKNAADPVPATKDAADGDPTPEEISQEETHAKVATAMKCLTKAMGHGMCADSLAQTQTAHDCLKTLLPEDYPYNDVDPEENPVDPDEGEVQNAARVAATKQLESIAAEIVTKRAELEQLSSTATQRAAEVTAAEAKIADLTTETKTLQQTIDQLKATPTGRQTAQAGGSSGRAGYQKRSDTVADARKRLGAALSGAPVDDPALRPA